MDVDVLVVVGHGDLLNLVMPVLATAGRPIVIAVRDIPMKAGQQAAVTGCAAV
jgi:hypothetical protein